jgi:hypothetical protein
VVGEGAARGVVGDVVAGLGTEEGATEGAVGGGEDEIWPGPITANAGGIAMGKTTVGDTAGPTAGSVVVHATDTGGPRIACADLS